jgi:hypothetical protein
VRCRLDDALIYGAVGGYLLVGAVLVVLKAGVLA